MSDMDLVRARSLSRDLRAASRTADRYQVAAYTRTTRVNADTDVALAKIDNLTMVAGAAMSSVLRVTMAQRTLEQLAPDATGRLSYIAEEHMLSVGDVLSSLRQDFRRA